MRKLLVRGGLSLFGVVVTLAWFTYGPKGKTVVSSDHIPAKIGIGGQTLKIEAENSSAATMRVSFEDLSKPTGEQRLMESWEKIPAGTRSWSIDLPPGVGGYIELGADHPNAGDTLTMRVRMNGTTRASRTDDNVVCSARRHANDVQRVGSPSRRTVD